VNEPEPVPVPGCEIGHGIGLVHEKPILQVVWVYALDKIAFFRYAFAISNKVKYAK